MAGHRAWPRSADSPPARLPAGPSDLAGTTGPAVGAAPDCSPGPPGVWSRRIAARTCHPIRVFRPRRSPSRRTHSRDGGGGRAFIRGLRRPESLSRTSRTVRRDRPDRYPFRARHGRGSGEAARDGPSILGDGRRGGRRSNHQGTARALDVEGRRFTRGRCPGDRSERPAGIDPRRANGDRESARPHRYPLEDSRTRLGHLGGRRSAHSTRTESCYGRPSVERDRGRDSGRGSLALVGVPRPIQSGNRPIPRPAP